jgi:hypothetical protein
VPGVPIGHTSSRQTAFRRLRSRRKRSPLALSSSVFVPDGSSARVGAGDLPPSSTTLASSLSWIGEKSSGLPLSPEAKNRLHSSGWKSSRRQIFVGLSRFCWTQERIVCGDTRHKSASSFRFISLGKDESICIAISLSSCISQHIALEYSMYSSAKDI